MISNITQGKGYGGVLRYCEQQKGAELVATNCLGDKSSDIAKEMYETREMYEGRAKKTVFHVSLNPAQGDQIRDAREMGEDYLKEMGLDPDQHEYAMYKHNEKGREHYHIIANRISRDGQETWKDDFSKRRSMDACRELEKKYQLHRETGQDKDKKIKRSYGEKYEKYQAARYGLEEHPKQTLRRGIDDAARDAKNRDEFEKNLTDKGISATYSRGKDGNIRGVTFTLDEENTNGMKNRYAGSSLGKDYSYNGVNQKIEAQQEQSHERGRQEDLTQQEQSHKREQQKQPQQEQSHEREQQQTKGRSGSSNKQLGKAGVHVQNEQKTGKSANQKIAEQQHRKSIYDADVQAEMQRAGRGKGEGKGEEIEY